MPNFSEADLFLLRRWTDTRLLEEALKTARRKYEAIWEKVLDKVQAKHQSFDFRDIRLKNDGVNIRAR